MYRIEETPRSMLSPPPRVRRIMLDRTKKHVMLEFDQVRTHFLGASDQHGNDQVLKSNREFLRCGNPLVETSIIWIKNIPDLEILFLEMYISDSQVHWLKN